MLGSISLIIRADASPSIGAGHFMRCLALAQAARSIGKLSIWIALDLPASLGRLLLEQEIDLHNIGGDERCLGDSETVHQYAESSRGSWIVIDGYHFTADYLAALSSHPILLLDDEGGRPGSELARLVLNQNAHASHDLYSSIEPDRLLLGQRFALLRTQFTELPPSPLSLDSSRIRVLVVFGSSDIAGLTIPVTQALSRISGLDVSCILGHAGDRSFEDSTLSIHHAVDNVATLIAEHDVVVTSAGSTVWECSFLGRAIVACPTTSNQEAVAKSLRELGTAIVVNASIDELVNAVVGLQKNPEKLTEIAQRAADLIDGRGRIRVLERMFEQGKQS